MFADQSLFLLAERPSRISSAFRHGHQRRDSQALLHESARQLQGTRSPASLLVVRSGGRLRHSLGLLRVRHLQVIQRGRTRSLDPE